ncbi:MAG: hypothetical protein KIG95_05790 [Comamonas sp.]|nr:hypothetical protein [Comamonas sp.]
MHQNRSPDPAPQASDSTPAAGNRNGQGYSPSGRSLSLKQLQIAFFSRAFVALSTVSRNRNRVLPRLNRHPSGRLVRVEVYETLEKTANSLLCRLDLATGTLGWVDEQGRMHLCNQRQLAADCGVSTSALSRLFELMEHAGYVKRSIRLLTKRQSKYLWTVRTQTIITFTPAFFCDLGATCHYSYKKAKKWAIKRREKLEAQTTHLNPRPEVKARARAAEQAKRQQRKRSFSAWVAREKEHEEHQRRRELNRVLAEVAIEHASDGLTPHQIRDLAAHRFRRMYPES